MDLKEIALEGVDWTDLTQDGGKRWAVVNAIMDLWVP
jgi:hypothetical protein